MVIRNYSVSLEEDVVTKSKELYKQYGTKLSPLLNELLKRWCEEEKRNRETK